MFPLGRRAKLCGWLNGPAFPNDPARRGRAGSRRSNRKGETGRVAVGPEDPVGGHHVVGMMGHGVRHADRKGADHIGVGGALRVGVHHRDEVAFLLVGISRPDEEMTTVAGPIIAASSD